MQPSFTATNIERVGNAGFAVTVACTVEEAEIWRRTFCVKTKDAQGFNEALKQAADAWTTENPSAITELGDKVTATVQGWVSEGMAKARALFGGRVQP